MYYSINLLKNFISIDDTSQNIANNLTYKTCEIEEIIERQIPQDIVIWKAIEVKQHPNADKLIICQIDCWDKWKYQICTWWTNIKEWIFVPVALPWCYLPAINLKISPRPMRWLESNWMICSKEELWIPEDWDKHRIRNLNDDFDDLTDQDLWKPLWEKFPRMNNTLLDVDNKTITHRPDLTGHFWLACELFAIYPKSKIKFHKLDELYNKFNDTNIFNILKQAKQTNFNLEITSPNVRSYILLELNNVKIKKSSLYTRLQILDSWSQPRSNWVDFSNLFMLISWNPVHFFDADKVKWKIIVRQAKDWEKFIDLFDNEHILNQNNIVIADQEKILALAWVVWWKNSWIDENTQNILVEIANFDPVSVRKTSQKIWLRTDAVMRFEKNISPTYTLYMLELFMDMLKKYEHDLWNYNFNWIKYYFTKEVENRIYNPTIIKVNKQTLNNVILWKKWDQSFENEVNEILTKLWFEIKQEKISDPTFFVKVPQRRSTKDISIQEDIHEEVARLYWYDKIPNQTLYWSLEPNTFLPFVKTQREIEEFLVLHWKFDQLETYPRVEEKILNIFETNKNNLLSLQNPVSPEQKFMRDCMIYNLLMHTKKNHKFFDKFKIFDIWKTWKVNDKIVKWDLEHDNFFPENISENLTVWLIIYDKNNNKKLETDNFLELKSLLEILLKKLNVNHKLEKTNKTQFHPKKQWKIIMNKDIEIWFIWQLHPLILNKMKIYDKWQVVYWELNISKILENSNKKWFKSNVKYDALQDQIIKRDLCFVVGKDESFEKIIKAVKNTQWVEKLEIFDLYTWENLPKNKKSISLTITIKWDWNMINEQINNIMNDAITNVEKTWAKLRQ